MEILATCSSWVGGGESIAKLEQTTELRREVKRSNKEIRALGMQHLDLRPDNILGMLS